MLYTIGEVSELLHISRDMIRYYEKQGTIHSKRNSKNNYRCYDEMDIFWLWGAMRHKSWGFNIAEIPGIRLHQYNEQTDQHLAEITENLEEEIARKTLLLKRLKSLKRRNRFSYLNIGNYQVREVPAHYRMHFIDGEGDHYQRFDFPGESSSPFFSDKIIPFTDSGFTLHGNVQSWELMIQKDYADQLGLSVSDDFKLIESRICLCTNTDVGPIGSFTLQAADQLQEYAVQHQYRTVPDAPIRSLLIGRGMENGEFHRIVELQLDIELAKKDI